MPRKNPDPYSILRPVVQQLGQLTHDELRDLVDMLQADRATQQRDVPKRKGLPPVDPEKGHLTILYGGWQYRDDPPKFTKESRSEFQQAYAVIRDQSLEARLLIEEMALQLRQALQPVPERRRAAGVPIAEGDLQAKVVYLKKYDADLKEVVKVAYGPYLYYRYWISSGDKDKRKHRFANEYIGQQTLALLYNTTPPGSPERAELKTRIIAAHKAGTIDDLMMELGLDDAILDQAGVLPNQPPEQEFLPDYRPEPNRKLHHDPHELTDQQREVLATYAAGLNYSADYREGITKRRIARWLAEKDLLREYTGYTDHRMHRWALTEYGLKVVRQDKELQALITQKQGKD